MAETTPNIGLHKPLESEFVDIATLNGNMDQIDQAIGVISEVPTISKNAAGAITEIYDKLNNRQWESMTLRDGVQIVQGGDVPAILHPTMKGRTLVNMLGRVGNFESLSGWVANGAFSSIALDSANKLYGNNSLKVTIVSGTTATAYRATLSLSNTKYYLFVADLNRGTANNAKVFIDGTGLTSAIHGNEVSGNDFQVSYRTLSPAEVGTATAINVHIVATGSANQYVYADGYRMYEITAAEKSYIDSLDIAEAQAYIATNYPYVDDMKHVNAVYIENKGKNLLPPFSEWNAAGGSVNATGPYMLAVTATATFEGVYAEISVTKNTDLVLKVAHNGRIGAFKTDGSTSLHGGYTTNQQVTFNTGENDRIRIYFTSTAAGPFTFTNPMLNVGSEPLPFEPQKPSYLYLPECNLRSNIDGSLADQLYTDGMGKPRAIRRYREVLLDGTLPFIVQTDYSGFKQLTCALSSFGGMSTNSTNMTGIKYDGKVMQSVNTSSAADQVYAGVSNLSITVSDTDSGWGESYTPSADEIKAYFNGWRMYRDGIADDTTPYSSGTKAWRHIVPTGATKTGHTTTLPTTVNPLSTWTPYRLMYQLAQSVDEPLTYEGSLMLHEGNNQVEVGTGIMVREAAPLSINYGVAVAMCDATVPSKYRTQKIEMVYKNSLHDALWYESILGPYGLVKARLDWQNYDPTAAYSVTYLALDTYMIGIAPKTVGAAYAPNIKTAVDDLVRELVEARTETSVLQNTKAQKQQPQWITPTLVNNWVNDGNYETAKYLKDEMGFVHIVGVVKNGAYGSSVFYLPQGYRPKDGKVYTGMSFNGTNSVECRILINEISGAVSVQSPSTVLVSLEVPPFEAN